MQAVDKIWVRPSEEDKATYQWCLSHAEGHWEEGKGTFDLLAAKLGRERRVRLVAPALDVTLHQVNLPHRNKSVLSKALPFALEDWLAEDLNNLHICVLNREPPDLVTAAVIKRSLMSQWLSDAEAAGLDVIQIVPELFLVPCSEGDLSLVVDKTQCIVRTSRWSGFSLDMNEGGLFQKQLQSLVDEADGRLIQWLSKDCGDIGLPLDLEENAQRYDDFMFGKLIRDGERQNGVDLLQGVFARSANDGWSLQSMLPAALILLLALCLYLGAEFYQLSSLESEIARVQNAAEEQFKKLFPDVKRIVDMDVQSTQALERLRRGGQGDGGSFLKIMSITGGVIKARGDVIITSLRYSDGVLQVQVNAPELAVLDIIKNEMESVNSLSVVLISATTIDQGIDGRLRISGGLL